MITSKQRKRLIDVASGDVITFGGGDQRPVKVTDIATDPHDDDRIAVAFSLGDAHGIVFARSSDFVDVHEVAS